MATYDIAGARAAGVPEEDIQAAIAAGPPQLVQVQAHTRMRPIRQPVPPQQVNPNGSIGWPPAENGQSGRLGAAALNLLPAVGGGVGGALGAAGGTLFGLGVGGVPGAMGGAAVGGAGGEAVRQLLARSLGMPAPPTATAAAQGIEGQGLMQGAMEGGGQLLAGLGRVAAPGLMRAAQRIAGGETAPTAALEKAFPRTDFAQEALDRGVTNRAGAKAVREQGAETAHSLVEQAAANNPTNIAMNQSPDDIRWIIQQRGGLAYGPKNFMPTTPVKDFMGDILAKSSTPKADLAYAKQYLQQWARDNAHRISPEDWYDAAQGLQTEAQQTYLRDQGKGAAAQLASSDLEAKIKQKLATAIKSRLGDDIPGLTAADRATQTGMALERSFGRAQMQRGPLGLQVAPLLAGGAAALGAHGMAGGVADIPAALAAIAATHAATNPSNLAVAAQWAKPLATQVGQNVLGQLPRGAGWLLQSMLQNPAQGGNGQ